jgi:uncharacterized membrane protein YbhN (UPF0104 family)
MSNQRDLADAAEPIQKPTRGSSSSRSDSRPGVGRRLATFGLLAVLALTLSFSAPGLRGVLHAVGHINPMWIALAAGLELASELSFVVLFRLFFDRLPGRDALALAWTELASGALLPGGGTGGLAIGGWLIHLTGAPTRWIAQRSGALFFLASAVSVASLIGAGLTLIATHHAPHGFLIAVLPTVLVTAATVAVAALPRLLRSRTPPPRWLRAISAGVQDAQETTFRHPSWRLAGALGYLGFDIAVLWVCLHALGHTPSAPVLTLAYTIGYLANTLPIPGGIGALDAGLTGALVLYGVSPAHAAAAVLVYHAVSLWIPGVGGISAFLYLRPRLLARNRGGLPPSLTDLAGNMLSASTVRRPSPAFP